MVVMEHLEGGTLRQHIIQPGMRWNKRCAPLPPAFGRYCLFLLACKCSRNCTIVHCIVRLPDCCAGVAALRWTWRGRWHTYMTRWGWCILTSRQR